MLNKMRGFTLAEVLITLGIIGVVAAMTLPALIQKYRNQVVETRLAKVYSVMNQAILRSEVDNGPKEYWDFSSEDFFEKYFAPYLLKVTDTPVRQEIPFDYDGIVFTDGSMLLKKRVGNDYFFFPEAKNFSMDTLNDRTLAGSYYFPFRFIASEGYNYHTGKGFEPYKHNSTDGRNAEDYLISGDRYSCNTTSATPMYCTALIQRNGWKIPKDYPFKLR